MPAFDALDFWWWPYLFVLVAGWLATDFWRFLGVFIGGGLSADSEVMILVRAIATALVAGVIARIVLFPAGSLATAPIPLRLLAVAAGFAFFWWIRRNLLIGLLVAETVLIGGWVLI